MMDQASTDEEAPSTPSTIYLEEDELFSPRTKARVDGVFARLLPINWPAKLSFHDIAEMMKLDPSWNLHSRQYIHVEEKQQELPSDPCSSDDDSESESRPAKIWVGHYRLNLDQDPANRGIGWIVGSGRKELEIGV